MERAHRYRIVVDWTGNLGTGTSGYRAYGRNHEISADGKSAPIPGSSDPHFRGDASRYNPEELLVASLSACHMLSFLHLCADRGIVVTSYRDKAEGVMKEHADGSGEFAKVVLRPRVTLADSSRETELEELHDKAHHLCFIARSVNFPVEHEAAVNPTAIASDSPSS
ncbi:MAG TPA: OsmC family protein [Bryobacteraceae bacterium]|nr:OsmC family protein [Bryobacteraceae bacterium]